MDEVTEEELASQMTPDGDEPGEPGELAPDENEEAEEAEQPADPQPEPEPQGLTEKQLEQRMKRIDTAASNYRNKIGDILGDDLLIMQPCPLCTDGVPAFIFPGVAPPEVVEAVRPVIGLPDLHEFKDAPHAHRCDTCAGRGVVLSGSFVQGNEAISCPKCSGSGFVVDQATGPAVTPPAPTNGAPIQELPEGLNPEDPAVKELRARGFTVFPPVPLPAGQ
jgi:hypothetical protein